jgi:hypothetical protein
MSSKSPPVLESKDERKQDAPASPVLLRDESDDIIDNLKSQLGALQKQLVRYRRTERARAGRERPPEGETGPGLREDFQAALTPHLAERLSLPAEELTARLDRLIERAGDSELREDLQRSRDTAFFLFDTFRRIGEQHELLTQTLTADTLVIETEDFLRRLSGAMGERKLPARVEVQGALPGRLRLAPQSVITVLATLANLAVDIFREPIRLELSCPEGPEGGDPAPLCLRVISEKPWPGPAQEGELSSVAIRAGVRSPAVVDLLYVEKILEMRGGGLGFFLREGRAHGFEALLPLAPLEGEAPAGASAAEPR